MIVAGSWQFRLQNGRNQERSPNFLTRAMNAKADYKEGEFQIRRTPEEEKRETKTETKEKTNERRQRTRRLAVSRTLQQRKRVQKVEYSATSQEATPGTVLSKGQFQTKLGKGEGCGRGEQGSEGSGEGGRQARGEGRRTPK
ncbi:hypothetical protein NDU88_008799 [Pleurodeles waltl]|uniref:Uncharacterized protein n=1 Tax=Pleurodeles waltl TaxID=8319 RepID=A0AAV7RTF4_PLEWA|nr:hypothetical protein NDU88_008799 [Pleurodeles waltl]